jgi:hypothetical protein
VKAREGHRVTFISLARCAINSKTTPKRTGIQMSDRIRAMAVATITPRRLVFMDKKGCQGGGGRSEQARGERAPSRRWFRWCTSQPLPKESR